ncbi:MAG TPA: hypothetical protein VHZ78_13515 [Rhizomicrobium sp.]|jgi:hypothetical protein|nr:hypothetical protein [Rhizomicrobium sp.]
MARLDFACLAVALWLGAGTGTLAASDWAAGGSAADVTRDLAASNAPDLTGKCDVRIDISLSIGGETRSAALDDFDGVFDKLVERFGCRTLTLSAFTASAFPIAMMVFDLTAAPKPPICKITPSTDPVCHVYPKASVCTQPPRDVIEKCDRDKAEQLDRWSSRHQAVLASARRFLASLKTMDGPGSHTAIYANAAYGLAQAQDVVILTDGDSDSPWPEPGQPKTITVRPSARLIFLLVKGTNDPTGAKAMAHAIEAQRAFPNSIVVPLQAALAPSFWDGLR